MNVCFNAVTVCVCVYERNPSSYSGRQAALLHQDLYIELYLNLSNVQNCIYNVSREKRREMGTKDPLEYRTFTLRCLGVRLVFISDVCWCALCPPSLLYVTSQTHPGLASVTVIDRWGRRCCPSHFESTADFTCWFKTSSWFECSKKSLDFRLYPCACTSKMTFLRIGSCLIMSIYMYYLHYLL